MTTLRLIGDVHGDRRKYLKLIKGAEYSLQVGDMDLFGYAWLSAEHIDPERHKFIGGNHDHYPTIKDSPHNLGDYGVWSVPGVGDIFYVRGAWSIDHKMRLIGWDWFLEEELSYQESQLALELYEQVKPNIVVSHTCSNAMMKHVVKPGIARSHGFPEIVQTRTGSLIQAMADIHCPKIHIFGHNHKHFDAMVDWKTGELGGSTRAICLDINEKFELDGSYSQ